MISRSSLLALIFACFATLSLAVAASVQQQRSHSVAKPAAAVAMTVYQLPRVHVVGKVNKQLPADPAAGN